MMRRFGRLVDLAFHPVDVAVCRVFGHVRSPFQRTCVRCGKRLDERTGGRRWHLLRSAHADAFRTGLQSRRLDRVPCMACSIASRLPRRFEC